MRDTLRKSFIVNVQLPTYRASDPVSAATEEQSVLWDLLNEDVTRSVLAHAGVPSLSNLVKVNQRLTHLAKAELWTQLFSHNNGSIPQTRAEVTDMRIERFLTADGPGVQILANAITHFPNLARLHANVHKVEIESIRTMTPKEAKDSAKQLLDGGDATGLALAESTRTMTLEEAQDNAKQLLGGGGATGLALAVYALVFIRTTPHKMLSVPAGMFASNATIVSIEVPLGFKGIDAHAFNGCTSLESVELPASLTLIGFRAFAGCTTLASAELPVGLTILGSRAFAGCTALASVELPASLTLIGNGAFAGCTSLASVVLPDGLTSIAPEAFAGCTTLASVELPVGLTHIGKFAFQGCSSLASVQLPDGLTSIGDGAFQGCSSLASVQLPDGLTRIGKNAFPFTN